MDISRASRGIIGRKCPDLFAAVWVADQRLHA
jgi:hypothetical protein